MRIPASAVHGTDTTPSLALTVVLLLAGLGASVVVGLALAALARRRSTPYVLVALAVLTVLARALVGALSLQGFLAPDVHHLTEHALDVAMVALVIAAVLVARRRPRTES